MSSQTRSSANITLNSIQDKIQLLKNIQPFLLDVSLRENNVGSLQGHVLSDKIQIFSELKSFGIEHIILGALNYMLPEELEVDDDFMMYLRDSKVDMAGCYAFTSMGLFKDHFVPDPSQVKLKNYCVPNTVHEIYLSNDGMKGLYDFETLLRSLPLSIQWLTDNIEGENSEGPKIIINIVDGCDAFIDQAENVFAVLELLSTLPIQGVSFQDDRGTFMPFQVGGFTSIIRNFLPASMKVLVHVHAGAGLENSSVIEALLNGADGVWGAIPKAGPVVGHASLGELIANLVRVGNQSMNRYQLGELIPLTNLLEKLDGEDRAYKHVLTLSFFKETEGRFMDLVPEALGGEYKYRICPVVSDPEVLRGRLIEVLDGGPGAFPHETMIKMIRLMRQDLRSGKKIIYNDPEELVRLLDRARLASPDRS
jgi:hypothetical protein